MAVEEEIAVAGPLPAGGDVEMPDARWSATSLRSWSCSTWVFQAFSRQTTGVKVSLILGVVVLVIVVAAVGGSGKSSTPSTTVAASVPAPASAPAGAAATPATAPPSTADLATASSAPPGNAPGVVLSLAGMELDQAESTLQAQGLGYRTIGGGTFGVVIASDWTVCSQAPSAGSSATAVVLVVARACT